MRELLCGSRRFGDVRRGIPRRRVNVDALPAAPVVARIEISDARRRDVRHLLLRRSEVSLCSVNPGFPEELHVRAPSAP